MTAIGLFFVTAFCEIIGCYGVYAVVKLDRPPWLLAPSIAALVAFAWLLTLHPSIAGRTYAAYAGAYLVSALVWMRLVEGESPNRWDLLGSALALLGAVIIVAGSLRTNR
jgi:small multidrug resistance family-3 protein